jgi:hypothetical protein
MLDDKLTAFGGTFLATLPIFAIITNSYTIKLNLNEGTILCLLDSIKRPAVTLPM